MSPDQCLEDEMRRKIEWRGSWFESEYNPEHHGNPYLIMFRDIIEFAADRIMKKAISELFKAPKSEPMYGGVSNLMHETAESYRFRVEVPRPATAVQRFI